MMNMSNSQNDSPTRAIRKDFFAFRNGIIADKLRNAGDPHSMIMGCLLADVMDISNRLRMSINDDSQLAAVAQELWQDTNSRECRLAAPMLFPPALMNHELALQWCQNIESVEIADNLCHKLLRYTSSAQEVCHDLIIQDRQLTKYTGYRLLLNLLLMGKIQPSSAIRNALQADANKPLFASLIKDILEEIEN